MRLEEKPDKKFVVPAEEVRDAANTILLQLMTLPGNYPNLGNFPFNVSCDVSEEDFLSQIPTECKFFHM
jgi:hypothetical protein